MHGYHPVRHPVPNRCCRGLSMYEIGGPRATYFAHQMPFGCSASRSVPELPSRTWKAIIEKIFLVSIVLAFLFGPGMSVASSQDPPQQILRFVEGIDVAPVPMTANEAASQLNDPWGALVLRKVGIFPGSLDEVLTALDNLNQGDSGVPVQSS